MISLNSPEALVAAKLAAIKARAASPAPNRPLFRVVRVKAAPTPAQKAARARREMAALRARLGR